MRVVDVVVEVEIGVLGLVEEVDLYVDRMGRERVG